MTKIHKLSNFAKPPRKFLWFTFCNHVWKEYWESLDESTQRQAWRCARCLKDSANNPMKKGAAND